jgi:hypothetical protein
MACIEALLAKKPGRAACGFAEAAARGSCILPSDSDIVNRNRG